MTECSSKWSIDTAVEHLQALVAVNDKRYEQQFDAISGQFQVQKEAITTALSAAERASEKAERATEKRFESVNEFRGALDNQQRTLIGRSEVSQMFAGLSEKVDRLQQQSDAFVSERTGIKGGWGYAAGAVGFVLGILGAIATVVAIFGRS